MMLSGFSGGVIAGAWGVTAFVTLYSFAKMLPIAQGYFSSNTVAMGVTIGSIFLLTLLIVSIITLRISDMILDSRVGALDRTLGFLFGLGRGLIIVVVAFLFFAWLVPDSKQPDGVRNAKSLEVLNKTGEWLQALLPQDMDNYLSQWFKKRPKGGEDQEPPPEAPPPGQRSDSRSPEVTGSVPTGYQRSDRNDMKQLIDATGR